MRLNLRLDDAAYAVVHHPFAIVGVGLAAALLSWLLTRASQSG